MIPDWYNKEIGQSKARKALADALQKYSSMERPMAKTVAKSIIDDIVDAITKELEKIKIDLLVEKEYAFQ